MIKISVNIDISVIRFYGYIEISMDIFTKISMDIFTKISKNRKLYKIHENTLKIFKNDKNKANTYIRVI